MSKSDRVFSCLYALFGGFTFLCFFTYFVKLLFSPEAVLPYFATTFMICVTALPFLFRKKLRRILRRAYLPLKAMMSAAFIIYTISFIVLVSYIYLSPVTNVEAPQSAEPRVYVVFGAKIKQSGPTATLASRLDVAADALKADESAICIVTGGQGVDEPETEAASMKRYLISLGIGEERIFAEEKARNTLENIRYSTKLLSELGEEERRIVCVSTDTHIPRISLMCRREGVEAEFLKAPFPKKEYLFPNWVREHLSYVKMFLMGG